MVRQSPVVSATQHCGKTMKGKDGNYWFSKMNVNGVCRWYKTNQNVKTRKKKTEKTITREELRQLLKRNHVSTSNGNKTELAERLWEVRSISLSNHDLKLILHLLSYHTKSKVLALLRERQEYPITNYKGMWKKQPKPIAKMTRTTLIQNLRSFRDAYEQVTQRDQDLSDERLANESTPELRRLIKYYYSEDARLSVEDTLRRMKQK
jgi:hypothetical protein